MIRLCILLGALATSFLQGGTPKRHQLKMFQVKEYSFLSLWGGWDQKGIPYLMDVALFNRRTEWPRIYPAKVIESVTASGGIRDDEFTVEAASHGEGKTWSATIPADDYMGFRLRDGQAASLEGRLECNEKEQPAIEVEDGADGLFRWEVKGGCGVLVDVTVNDAESWEAMGQGAKGEVSLQKFLPQLPVVRIQAFRGLRAFVAFFVPGQGFLENPWPYLVPSYIVGNRPRVDGGSTGLYANPSFDFQPSFPREVIPRNLIRIKFTRNFRRLPFKVDELFSGKFIQTVFQAEWSVEKPYELYLSMHPRYLQDETKARGLSLMRVIPKDGGGWEVQSLSAMRGGMIGKGHSAYYVGEYRKKDRLVTFKDYYVVVSDIHEPLRSQVP